MSERPELMEAFDGIPLVELTAPDGKVYKFRYGAMIPYAGEEYAVLLEMELDERGEEQVLVTRIEKTPMGGLGFVVEQDPDIVRAVFDAYVAIGEELGMNDGE